MTPTHREAEGRNEENRTLQDTAEPGNPLSLKRPWLWPLPERRASSCPHGPARSLCGAPGQ